MHESSFTNMGINEPTLTAEMQGIKKCVHRKLKNTVKGNQYSTDVLPYVSHNKA
jgi:hypothetical protein